MSDSRVMDLARSASASETPAKTLRETLERGLTLLVVTDADTLSQPVEFAAMKAWAREVQTMLDEAPRTETPRKPVAWIADNGAGKTLHFAKADGWTIEAVQSLPEQAPQPIEPQHLTLLRERDEARAQRDYWKATAEALPSATPANTQAQALADAVLAYDTAIYSCSNDPEKMASFCSAQGDDLDTLYANMIAAARTVIPEEPQRG